MSQSQTIIRSILPLVDELKAWSTTNDVPQAIQELLKPKLDQLDRKLFTNEKKNVKIYLLQYGQLTEQEQANLNLFSSMIQDDPGAKEGSHVINLQIECSTFNFDVLKSEDPAFAYFFIPAHVQKPDLLTIVDHVTICSSFFQGVVIISSIDWNELHDERMKIDSTYVKLETWDELAKYPLNSDNAILQEAKSLEIFDSLKHFATIENINQVINLAAKQIEHDLKIKRQTAIQEEAAFKTRSSSMRISQSSEIKSKLTSRLDEFSKRYEELMEATADADPNAQIFQDMVGALEKLPELEKEKRAKNIAYTVPTDFQAAWLNYLSGQVEIYCKDSTKLVHEFTNSINQIVKDYLHEHNITLNLPNPSIPDQSKDKQLLPVRFAIEVPYEGSAVKKKPMELLSGARMYIMMFMMLASMLGVGSLLRKQPEYFVPFTLLLLGLGVWQYLETLNKENQENAEKYSLAAKEHYKKELTKMLQDFNRAWDRLTIDQVSNWVNMILKELETTSQKIEQHSIEKRESEASRAKLISENLRSQESSFNTAIKAKSSFERTLSKNKTDLAQQLRAQLSRLRSSPQQSIPEMEKRRI